MKEIQSIINAFRQIDFEKNKAALITVVKIQGSSYRRTGARMLVLDNGSFVGGISGGCLEGDALRRAQKAIYKNKPAVVTYDTTQQDGHQIGVGLGCNGIIDVLITPLQNGEHSLIHLLEITASFRCASILVTIAATKNTPELLGQTFSFFSEEQFMESFPIKSIVTNLLKDIKATGEKKTSQTIVYSTQEDEFIVFIELLIPPIQLVIYGSNPDTLPLTILAGELGWCVLVVTNLSKANKLLFKHATKIIDHTSQYQPVFDAYTAVVLMAHDYKTDLFNLQKLLPGAAAYIGLLGPKKRSEKMLAELAENDISLTANDIERIYAPCGLDIGAANPEEIALSIIAEIRSHFSGRKGMSLKFRDGPIYNHQ